MPSPIGVASLTAGVPYATISSFGSLYLSPRTMMARAMPAISLASATAATFVGRRVEAYLVCSRGGKCQTRRSSEVSV